MKSRDVSSVQSYGQLSIVSAAVRMSRLYGTYFVLPVWVLADARLTDLLPLHPESIKFRLESFGIVRMSVECMFMDYVFFKTIIQDSEPLSTYISWHGLISPVVENLVDDFGHDLLSVGSTIFNVYVLYLLLSDGNSRMLEKKAE